MHSSEYNGYDFLYNGDYSGTIKVINPDETEFEKSFTELTITALYDRLELPFTQAARSFVASAAVNEAISRLEQMEPDEVLENSWLKDVCYSIMDTTSTP